MKQKDKPDNGLDRKRVSLPVPIGPPRVFRIDPLEYGGLSTAPAEEKETRTIRRRVVLIEETVTVQGRSTNNATTSYEIDDSGFGSVPPREPPLAQSTFPEPQCYSAYAPNEEKTPDVATAYAYPPRLYTSKNPEPLIDKMAGIRKMLHARYGFLAVFGIALFLTIGAVRLLKQGDREPRKIDKQEITGIENAIKPELFEILERRELQRIERATNPERMEKYLRAVLSGTENTMADTVIRKTFEIVGASGNGSFEELRLGSILDIYEFIRNDIRYLTFLGEDFPRTAESTLEDMMGDSKDKAVLFAAMCLALDARVEIIVADDHIYNAVRISQPDSESGYEEVEKSVRRLLNRRYGVDEKLNGYEIGFMTNGNGLWLVLDATNPGDHRFSPIFESNIKDVYTLGRGDRVLYLR